MWSTKNSFSCDYCGCNEFKIMNKYTKRLKIECTKYRIVECRNCGLVSLFPLPSEKELEIIYTKYADRKNRISVEKERKETVYPIKLEKLKNYSKGNKLLDIGAGLGTFVHLAQNYNFKATGVEYSKDQCEKAKNLWGVNLINNKIENIYSGFINEFDAVNLNHVLEHMYSPKKILGIIQKILRPGGICLIEVPNQFFNMKKEFNPFLNKNIKSNENPLHHLYFFSVKSLKNYIDNKFEIIEFNQFRPRVNKIPLWERMPKDFYRYIVKKFALNSGSFFEILVEKSNK
ncbi:MAG: class I SAM-dependent methyltransferase [Promethearchaeota archaeon]